MQIGDQVFVIAVRMPQIDLAAYTLRPGGFYPIAGTVVAIDDEAVDVDVPNAYKTPWRKPRAEVFVDSLAADAFADSKWAAMRAAIDSIRHAPSLRDT